MIFKKILQQPSKGTHLGMSSPEHTFLFGHFQALVFGAGINRKHPALL